MKAPAGISRRLGPPGTPHTPLRRVRTDRRLAALLAALALTAAGCSVDRTDAVPTAQEPTLTGPDPGFGHVHGLGLDPADGALYAATHYGLWRLPPQPPAGRPGPQGMQRVAGRFQDTMGFAVTGPGEFLGSGHPDPREPLPSQLGLIRSTDAGGSWQPVSLLGQADFHALQAAHGRVYGYDASSSTVLVSGDGGATWQRGHQGQLTDLAVDPTDPKLLLAGDGRRVLTSRDGGRTFAPRPGTPAVVALEWTDRHLIAADIRGDVWVSGDRGGSWTQRGRLAGAPHALTAAGDTVYAADTRGLTASTDGGRTFLQLVDYSTDLGRTSTLR